MDLKELPANNLLIRHPWEKSRIRFFSMILNRYVQWSGGHKDILDIGSGDGHFSESIFLRSAHKMALTCWDKNYSDHFIASNKKEGVKYIREAPLERFDLILLMDVLEHVEDDSGFLGSVIKNNLNSSGYLVISVPAWPCLFSTHDRALNHFRRYTPDSCLKLIRKHDLEILESGGLFHSLLLPRTIQKIWQLIKGAQKEKIEQLPNLGNWDHGKIFTFLVDSFLRFDNLASTLFSLMNLPIPGLSFWAICKKED